MVSARTGVASPANTESDGQAPQERIPASRRPPPIDTRERKQNSIAYRRLVEPPFSGALVAMHPPGPITCSLCQAGNTLSWRSRVKRPLQRSYSQKLSRWGKNTTLEQRSECSSECSKVSNQNTKAGFARKASRTGAAASNKGRAQNSSPMRLIRTALAARPTGSPSGFRNVRMRPPLES